MPPPQAKCLPQIVWVRRFSHRFHGIHRNSCWGYSPTDFTDLHRLFVCVDSPTDFTEFTETLAGDILPQISQICTDCLGAKILPQNPQNSQKLLWGMFSHRFHRSAQIVWVRRFSHRLHRIHRTSCWGYSPTDFTDQHRLFGCVDSPTESTEFTETLAGDILPQISQICTDCLGA